MKRTCRAISETHPVYRMYREEWLRLRNKTPRRKVSAKLREGRRPAAAANEVWATDFMPDQLFDDRQSGRISILDTTCASRREVQPDKGTTVHFLQCPAHCFHPGLFLQNEIVSGAGFAHGTLETVQI